MIMSVSTLGTCWSKIPNHSANPNLRLLNIWKSSQNWMVFSGKLKLLCTYSICSYILGAHFTVTRTVDSSFFFFSSFFFARSIILDEVCFQWRVGGGRIGLSLVDFLRWKNTLSGRGCHGRCDAFWKFQLNNPLSREAPWARAFDISSRYKTSRHGISKQNEIDGESMWFPTYHDHASGHKLKLVTY